MNTEPVKTTMRGVATFVTATAAVVQALLLFVSEVFKALGMSEIPIAVQQSGVALVTVALTWWTMIRAGNKLREQVTPYDSEIGAMTPGPTTYVASAGVGDGDDVFEPDDEPPVG